MTFKKYSIKSHYKVNKLVRIIKISHFKRVSSQQFGLLLESDRIKSNRIALNYLLFLANIKTFPKFI